MENKFNLIINLNEFIKSFNFYEIVLYIKILFCLIIGVIILLTIKYTLSKVYQNILLTIKYTLSKVYRSIHTQTYTKDIQKHPHTFIHMCKNIKDFNTNRLSYLNNQTNPNSSSSLARFTNILIPSTKLTAKTPNSAISYFISLFDETNTPVLQNIPKKKLSSQVKNITLIVDKKIGINTIQSIKEGFDQKKIILKTNLNNNNSNKINPNHQYYKDHQKLYTYVLDELLKKTSKIKLRVDSKGNYIVDGGDCEIFKKKYNKIRNHK